MSVQTSTIPQQWKIHEIVPIHKKGKHSIVTNYRPISLLCTLPHSKLLFKLWHIGITGPLWMRFKDYLSNRHHYVEINGIKSKLLPVLSRVPQGSVLGPLLFLIYINDLPSCISHSCIHLFADDTKLLLDVTKYNDVNLQHDLQAINNWCEN